MAKPSSRQWDPAAPSLLWAHAIRREHVHLVDQLDDLRADQANTLATVNKLITRVEGLHKEIAQTQTDYEHVNTRCETLILDVKRQIQSVSDRFAALEEDNSHMKKRLERVEKECTARPAQYSHAGRGIPARNGLPNAHADGICLRSDTGIRMASDVLVPDSMPMDEKTGVSSLLLRKGTIRGLSDTTWSSSGQSEGSIEDERTGVHSSLDAMRCPVFRQDGRSLTEYLSAATGGIGPLPPDETTNVRMFVSGLDDASMREVVERRLCTTEWTWDCLTAIVGDLSRGVEWSTKVIEMVGDGEKNGANKATKKQKQKRRQRRCIPIVPADEEDLMALTAAI